MSRKNIVVVGGGTGNHTTLTGLRTQDCHLTAIVAMTDSGGSSGRLRDELGHLPPGDLRRCPLALADEGEAGNLMRRLFEFRFSAGDGLNGHSFGNLLLAALTEVTGNTITAIEQASRLLGITGTVLPVTLTQSNLCARLYDGSELIGESAIDLRNHKLDIGIDYVYLNPRAYVYPPVLDAIAAADAIVLGPGDIYTSVLPNLLVEGRGTGYRRVSGHQDPRLQSHDQTRRERRVPRLEFPVGHNRIFRYSPSHGLPGFNNRPFPRRMLERYASDGQYPVALDEASCLPFVNRIAERPLLAPGVFLRHDPTALAEVIMELVAADAAKHADTANAPILDCDDFEHSMFFGDQYDAESMTLNNFAPKPVGTLVTRGAAPEDC